MFEYQRVILVVPVVMVSINLRSVLWAKLMIYTLAYTATICSTHTYTYAYVYMTILYISIHHTLKNYAFGGTYST